MVGAGSGEGSERRVLVPYLSGCVGVEVFSGLLILLPRVDVHHGGLYVYFRGDGASTRALGVYRIVDVVQVRNEQKDQLTT